MNDLKTKQCFKLNKEELRLLQNEFDTQMCTNECTYNTIQDIFNESNILIDPHTATAFPQDNNNDYNVVVSTASPYKFPKLYNQLFNLDVKDDFYILNKIEALTDEPYPVLIKELQNIEVRFKQNVSLDKIEDVLHDFITKEAI